MTCRAGLSESNEHQTIFHLLTGLCVLKESMHEPLRLGPCNSSEAWSYTTQKSLSLKGINLYLQVDGLGSQQNLAVMIARALVHNGKPSQILRCISFRKARNATSFCLDVDSDRIIMTNTCKCLSKDTMCDPESRRFKLVKSIRNSNF